MSTHPPRRPFAPALAVAGLLLTVGALVMGTTARAQSKRDFAVSAHRYGYRLDGSDKPEIRVQKDDLVRITFTSDDIPHSFTIDDETYRIMRRAEPGKAVTFDFRAEKEGRFAFRCTLTADPRCKELVGWLIVEPKK